MAHIEKRGNNAYRIVVSCGYGKDKKQNKKYLNWKPSPNMSEKQIEKELNRQAVLFEEMCLSKQGDELYGNENKVYTFEEYAELWFNEYARLNYKSTTYERMLKLRKRTFAAIGNEPIERITARGIQTFINDLFDKGKNEITGKPLAHKTIIHYLSFVSCVLSYAVKMGDLKENPCSQVNIPRAKMPVEKEIYSIEEANQLVQLLKNSPLKHRVFNTLAISSGLRRGELLGLEWKDIDWEYHVISVRRTSNYTKINGIYTDTTKNKKSTRFVKVPEAVINLLIAHKQEQENEKAMLKGLWNETDRIFVRWNGLPMGCNTPYKWLKAFCKRNNLKFYGIHAMRHCFASILINEGVDVATVSRTLGHSNTSTTLDIYTHYFQKAGAKVSGAVIKSIAF